MSATKRTGPSTRLIVLLSIVAIAIVIVVEIILAGNLTSTSTNTPTVVSTARPTDQQSKIVLITMVNPPSPTPFPSGTPLPTSTPRATSVPRPVTPTMTSTPKPDLATVLPALRDALAGKIDALFKLTDSITKELNDTANFSSQTAQKTLDWIAQIQKLRNDLVMTDLSALPPDVSLRIVIPVQSAYVGYANSFLHWIDLQVEANRMYVGLASVSAGDLKAAQQKWTDQKTLATNQAAMVATQRDQLKAALVAYNVEATRVVLVAKASDKAITITNQSAPTVKLAAGNYTVYYVIQVADNATADKVVLRLVPIGSAAAKVDLINGSKQKLTDSVEISLQEGTYQVQADAVAWWVLVFDPKS